MGMTLWIHTLEGRKMSRDSEDHTLMYELLDPLDALCDELGVEKLSSFQDMTDLELNMGDEYADEDEDEDEEEEDGDEGYDDDEEDEDPETGYSYGIDDMQWFSAAAGLETIRALRAHIADNGFDVIEDDEVDALLEELDDCIAQLEGPASRGGRFNLPVVM